jgi:hypothetical protein
MDDSIVQFSGPPGQNKNKRERASWQQRLVLEKLFQSNQYPDLLLRTQLAPQIGMNPRKIQIWFQNRRTKQKGLKKNSNETNLQPLTTIPPSMRSNINFRDKDGNTLLIIASAIGHDCVATLLNKGAKCNISNNRGHTALFVAVKNGHEHVVQVSSVVCHRIVQHS